MKLLAIDPGNEQSAFVVLDGETIVEKGILPNEEVLDLIEKAVWPNRLEVDHLAIEMIASYGMAVGVTVFETCVWIGRFIQAFGSDHTKIYRKDVKMNLCGSMKAKDANIRQALIDRVGEQGTKKNPGPTYGISKDVWSALAVGLTYLDLQSKS